MNKALLIAKRELTDLLRHKKVLISIFLPVFLYPALLVVVTAIMSIGFNNIEDQAKIVAIEQSKYTESYIQLIEDENIEFKEVESISEDDVANGEIDGAVSFSDQGDITIYYNAASDVSMDLDSTLYKSAKAFKDQFIRNELKNLAVDPTVMDSVSIDEKDVAPPAKSAGKALGMFIPLILIISVVSGTLYPAIDGTSGERERGTLETLFSFPLAQRDILTGKFLAVCSVGLMSAFANILSLALIYVFAKVQFAEILDTLSFTLPASAIIAMLIMLIPFTFFVAALMLGVAMMGKDYKESSSLTSYIMMLFLFPSYITMMPGIQNSTLLSSIPVVNLVMNMRDILMSETNFALVAICVFVNAALAFITIGFLAKTFTAEKTLFGGKQAMGLTLNRKNIIPKENFDVTDGLVVYGLAMLLAIYVGTVLQTKIDLFGFVLTQVCIIAGFGVLISFYFKVNLKKTLSLKAPSMKHLIPALLMTIGVLCINLTIGSLLEKVIDLSQFESAVDDLFGDLGPWKLILIMALTPAICEELLFRGVLLSAFKNNMSKWAAILLTSILFGAFHMNVPQFITTTLVGIVITFAVYESGSIYVGMICHFINNAIAVLFGETLLELLPNYAFTIIGAVILGAGILLYQRKETNKPKVAQDLQ